jgi:hypothetical protein
MDALAPAQVTPVSSRACPMRASGPRTVIGDAWHLRALQVFWRCSATRRRACTKEATLRWRTARRDRPRARRNSRPRAASSPRRERKTTTARATAAPPTTDTSAAARTTTRRRPPTLPAQGRRERHRPSVPRDGLHRPCDRRLRARGSVPRARIRLGTRVPAGFDRRLSRFRADSELTAFNLDRSERVPASPLLRALIRAAIWAARRSGGLVDPTLVRELCASGYSRSWPFAVPVPLVDALALAPPRRAAAPRFHAVWRDIDVEDEAGADRLRRCLSSGLPGPTAAPGTPAYAGSGAGSLGSTRPPA